VKYFEIRNGPIWYPLTLNRHFSQELEIDIIKDPISQKANDILSAVSVDLKENVVFSVQLSQSTLDGALEL
jgi:hypothetical protein